MIIDIHVRAWRFYLDVSKPKPAAPTPAAEESAPTHLATPMRIGTGFVTWQQIRAATETEAQHRGPS